MEDWEKIMYKVTVYIFLFEVRPLESYLTAYLTGPNGNVSLYEVANPMESIRSYSALTATVILLCISKYYYKPAIITFTFCSCIAYLLMTGSPSITQLRVSMAGIAATANGYVLVFSYFYAQISDRQHYQKVTSIVSVSLELGIVFGSILSQIIVSETGGIYTILPYCNAFAIFLAVICACLFPPVRRKHNYTDIMANMLNENTRLLENSEKVITDCCENDIRGFTEKQCLYKIINKPLKKMNTVKMSLNKLLLDFNTAYSNTIVLKWSLWYIIKMGVHLQIIANMNVLYTCIINKPGNHDVLSNGYAEAMVNLSGALGSYLIGKVRLDWTYYGDVFLAVCSTIMGVLMMSCYFYDQLVFVYISYIIYGFVSQITSVICLSEIAKHLQNECYSLVLGVNLFGSMLTSSILMIYFVEINVLNITIPGRFMFIGGLDVFLGLVFLFLYYNCIR